MLNKVILMGRLTRDPEARSNSAGLSISNFTLAVDRTFARQGEERQTDFIPIVAFRSQADFSLRYFKKGQLVAVVGRLQVRSWDDNEGKKRYATEVIAEELHFAESKRNSEDGGYQGGGNNYTAPQGGGYNPAPQQQQNPGFTSPLEFTATDDDDLPF